METNTQPTGRSSEELAAELETLRQQQSILRKALPGRTPSSPTYQENLDEFGDDPEEVATPLEDVAPIVPLGEGQVRLGDVPLGSLVRIHDTELRLTNLHADAKPPMVTGYAKIDGERRPMDFRASIPCIVLEAPPAPNPNWRAPSTAERAEPTSEVGASLTEHLEAQVPQEWAPELFRNDVPAYVAPEDRNAWLPVPEGSWWVWAGREDKAIVQVLEVDGPSPESSVTIKVPFSTTTQRWPAKDFGAEQRFEPIPELKGQFFFSTVTKDVFLVVEVEAENSRVLLHDQGAAEPQWDDLSEMLASIAKKRTRAATPEEVEAYHEENQAEGVEKVTDDRNLGPDGLYDVTPNCPKCGPYSFRVRFIGDGLIQPCPDCGKTPAEHRAESLDKPEDNSIEAAHAAYAAGSAIFEPKLEAARKSAKETKTDGFTHKVIIDLELDANVKSGRVDRLLYEGREARYLGSMSKSGQVLEAYLEFLDDKGRVTVDPLTIVPVLPKYSGGLVKKSMITPADPEPTAAPIPDRPPANGDIITQASEWLDMAHGYPSLGMRNDHGVEIASELADLVEVEYAPPSDLKGSKLTDSIAEAIRHLLEDIYRIAEAPSPSRTEAMESIERSAFEAACGPIPPDSHSVYQAEPEQPKPKARGRKAKTEQSAEATQPPTAEPQTFDELKAARDRHLAEAERLTAKMRDLHESERARKLAAIEAARAELEELDRMASEMGISA